MKIDEGGLEPPKDELTCLGSHSQLQAKLGLGSRVLSH